MVVPAIDDTTTISPTAQRLVGLDMSTTCIPTCNSAATPADTVIVATELESVAAYMVLDMISRSPLVTVVVEEVVAVDPDLVKVTFWAIADGVVTSNTAIPVLVLLAGV
jgi:hypothetical protein